jgi:2-oxoglutarate dehydrogenase E2 component (dihydrolipoamide succinyltransferase)
MKVDVLMPMLGEGITEGTIIKWWKKPGDYVKKEETLLEISTDKVDSEIPSPFDGTVTELLVEENETVEVGSVIAKIQSSQGAEAAVEKTEEKATPDESASQETLAKPSVQASTKPAEAVEVVAPPQEGGQFYSPLVRSIARKEGISKEELAQIPGTGLKGRVTKNDILQYLENQTAAPAAPKTATTEKRSAAPVAAAAPPTLQSMPSAEEVSEKWQGERAEVVPMDAIRKKIADHMVMSKHTSPHVYGVAECDFTIIMGIVAKNKAAFQQREGFKLTINPFILFSLVKAVKDFPDINCSIEGYNVIKKKYVNIGMAVATERGLIVPVLKNADELNFNGIARNAYDLAIRARDKKLNLEDVQGSTITVTNYGVFGNIIGFPIINQPNVAIMGVGAVKKRPVVLETEQGDMIGIRSIGLLTLSYDHRTVDGELGDKFLQRVRHYIENFQEDWM